MERVLKIQGKAATDREF